MTRTVFKVGPFERNLARAMAAALRRYAMRCVRGKADTAADAGGDAAVRSRIGRQWPLAEPSPPIPVPDGFPLLPYLVNVGLVLKRAS